MLYVGKGTAISLASKSVNSILLKSIGKSEYLNLANKMRSNAADIKIIQTSAVLFIMQNLSCNRSFPKTVHDFRTDR